MTEIPILEVRNLSKHFGAIKAVENVSIQFYKGQITAIVGDNGAGKSTLIKMISGALTPTTGEIYINGEKVNIPDTATARKYGIETVYQGQVLVEGFNAASNLFLGRERFQKNLFGKILKFLDFRGMQEETEKVLIKIGVKMKDTTAPVRDLSGGQRRSIEVGRAVYWGGKILIFDEPTNNLGVEQKERIIRLIGRLREEFDVSIIMISHDLEYVFNLVDRIVVLRNGKKVGDVVKSETTKTEIVSLITGLQG